MQVGVRTSERGFWQADGDIVKELRTGKVVNVQHQDAEQRKPPQNIEAGNSFGLLDGRNCPWGSCKLFF